MIDELEVTSAVRTLTEINQRQRDALSRENRGNKLAYLLSDFQKNMGEFQPDSGIGYNLIPLAADAQNNVFIDSVWFAEPVQVLNQQATLIIQLRNSGTKNTENSRLVLKLNGQTKTMGEVNIEAGSSVTDTMSFLITQGGWNSAELSISDYPITYDDSYFLSFKAVEKLNVMVVNGGASNPYLDAMFKYQPEFNYSSLSEAGLPTDSMKEIQLLVLSDLKNISSTLLGRVNSYVSSGGSVAIFPAANSDVESYNRLLNSLQANSITGFSEEPQELAGLNLQQYVFKNVFEKIPENMGLPQVMKHYTFTGSTTSNEEKVLTLKDGNSLLSRYPVQSGSVYVAAVPLDKNFSELPVHAIFVPLMYQMAMQGIHSENIAYTLGDKTRIELENTDLPAGKVYKIFGQGLEFIPEQFAVGGKLLLGLSEQIKKAGVYKFGIENSSAKDLLALNFDRRESTLDFYSASDLREKYKQPNVKVVDGAKAEVAEVVKELERGTPLWKICLILTLIFLGLEIALLRFWKV